MLDSMIMYDHNILQKYIWMLHKCTLYGVYIYIYIFIFYLFIYLFIIYLFKCWDGKKTQRKKKLFCPGSFCFPRNTSSM